MVNRSDFLTAYNKRLLKWVEKPITFKALKRRFEAPRFKNHIPYDYREATAYLLRLKLILDKITAIVFKPRVKSTTEEIIERSELSNQLSNEDFKQTVKDARNWRRKGMGMAPEYVHSHENVDTIVTYENAFIAQLVDCIALDAENALSDIAPLVRPIEQEYETKGVSYGAHSLLNDLASNGKPVKKSFFLEQASSQETLALLRNILKRIKNIKATEFYRFNAKKNPEKAIQKTNILLHDPLYAVCYRFYLDTYFARKSTLEEGKGRDYYNYVVSLLLIHFKGELDEGVKISCEDGYLSFGSLEVKMGLFRLKITGNPGESALDIETVLKLSKNNVSRGKYRLLIAPLYSEKIRLVLDEKRQKAEGISDVVLATMSNLLGEYASVLNLSVYREDNDALLRNFFSSLTLVFEAEPKIYENLCPVCGHKNPVYQEGEYHCSQCQALYAILTRGKKCLLHLKTLRREGR